MGRAGQDKAKVVNIDFANHLKSFTPPTRFERATQGLGIPCSILLSYGGNLILSNTYKNFSASYFFLATL